MFVGHLISTKHSATCWSCRGNIPELRVWDSASPHAGVSGVLDFQPFQSIIPLGSLPKRSPTATLYGTGPEQSYSSAILHQAGGFETHWECPQGGAELPWPASSAFWRRLCPPGIQHHVTQAWKRHKDPREGTFVNRDWERRELLHPENSLFSHL